MKLKLILIIFFVSLYATNTYSFDCYGLNLYPSSTGANSVNGLEKSFKTIGCMAKRERFQCQNLEDKLPLKDRAMIIQCDPNSQKLNTISEMNISDCIIDGFKISAESLLDLAHMPKKVMQYAIDSLQDGEKCYQDIDKKTKMARLFNLGISNPRFTLDEKFIKLTIPKMSCGEIQRTFEARIRVYADEVKREMHGNVINSRDYIIPDEFYQKSDNLVSKLNQIVSEAKIRYECYTPKAKAEILCSGLTSLIIDATIGSGILKGGQALIKFSNFENTYNAQRSLTNFNKALNRELASLNDVPLGLQSDAKKFLESSQYVDVNYGPSLVKNGKLNPQLLKDGSNYQTIYRPASISENAKEITRQLENLPKGESQVSLELNGQKVSRIIKGTNESAAIAVIGRGHDRVRLFQSGIHSETFTPSKAAVRLLEEQNDISLMIEENKRWIESVRKRGLTVIDLGMGNAREVGPFYKVELIEMQKYK